MRVDGGLPAADLAAFYPPRSELYLQSYALKGIEPVDTGRREGPVADLRDAARRNGTAVVVGAAIRETSGMANAALCIDKTGDAAIYRKVHLFAAEARVFSRGEEYVVVTSWQESPQGCSSATTSISLKLRAAVAAAGAELLVTTSANTDPYAVDHALYARVRALENRVPHVYVNAVGREGGLRFCGGSTVVDSSGFSIADLPAYEPSVRLVSVPLEHHPEDPRPDYLADRRPVVPARIARALALNR